VPAGAKCGWSRNGVVKGQRRVFDDSQLFKGEQPDLLRVTFLEIGFLGDAEAFAEAQDLVIECPGEREQIG